MNAVAATVGALNSTIYVNDGWQETCGGAPLVQGATEAASDSDRAAIGDEEVTNFLQNAINNAVTASTDFGYTQQRIEGVQRLSNKTVVVSFWARAVSGTPTIALELTQSFGSGGSPSAAVSSIGVQSFTLSTTWTQYFSNPITLPSSAGKTFGTTANSDFTQLIFWATSGSNFNSRNNTIGSQTFTWQLWGVQLEINSTATPLEKRTKSQELDLCRRYYQVVTSGTFFAAVTASQSCILYAQIPFPVRTQPTITLVTSITATNFPASGSYLAVGNANGYSLTDTRVAVATTGGIIAATYAVDARL